MVNPSSRATSTQLSPREELLVVRTGDWRFLLPMRHVERVHPAALPSAVPSAAGASPPCVALGGDLVPVVFAEALLGATEARLAPHHKMVLLSEQQRRALVWVDAVEDVVEHTPVEGPAGGREELVVGWSGGDRTLAVLDVQRLLDIAVGRVQMTSGRRP